MPSTQPRIEKWIFDTEIFFPSYERIYFDIFLLLYESQLHVDNCNGNVYKLFKVWAHQKVINSKTWKLLSFADKQQD